MDVKGDSVSARGNEVVKKRNIFNYLGPALITSALVLGPGSVTLSSKIGAIYGTQLVWTIVLAIILMMVYTEMSTRIGLAAKHSFIQTIKKKWGLFAGILIGVGAFLVTASFQAGNAIGTGIAISAVTDMDPTIWIIIFTLLSIGLLFAKQFYQILEKDDACISSDYAPSIFNHCNSCPTIHS